MSFKSEIKEKEETLTIMKISTLRYLINIVESLINNFNKKTFEENFSTFISLQGNCKGFSIDIHMAFFRRIVSESA